MRALVDAALAELGVRRLLLAIHDVSFPADPDEDLGRGAPSTRAAARLLPYVRALGFTGLQLGPQGQTSRSNPSPYDGTIFARHVGGIAVTSLRPGGPWAGLVDERALDAALLPTPGGPAQHAHAYDASHALVAAVHARVAAGAAPALAAEVARFRAAQAAWLLPNALFAALCDAHGGATMRSWPAAARDLPRSRDGAARAAVAAAHGPAIDRYVVGQYLAHAEHARVRARCADLGLALYGDLQVGYAEADAWAHAAAFLPGYAMGAPPSRTNPEGQPWGYPVLDPAQYGGAAGALVAARVDKALAEYDSLRIDHPHGLVCPWVYRAGAPDPVAAVRAGARLFESPDLPDHPALAAYAIARPDQLDRGQPRHADGWVRDLDEAQVTRYGALLDLIAAAAARHGRALADLSCEVLSTLPLPLARVTARLGLGRWRVTQKARLDDPTDVYRADRAARADWVMLGNHDTAPIVSVIRGWPAALRTRWVAHLARTLALPPGDVAAIEAAPAVLATAMLAELFACPAENVSIFVADLLGLEDRFNTPGTVSPANWVLRLPPDAADLHARRARAGEALDVARALAWALRARGSRSGIAAQLAP